METPVLHLLPNHISNQKYLRKVQNQEQGGPTGGAKAGFALTNILFPKQARRLSSGTSVGNTSIPLAGKEGTSMPIS